MKEIELFAQWVKTLLEQVERILDQDMKKQVLEECGRACARNFGSLEVAREVKASSRTIDEALEMLNRQEGFWCGPWIRDGKQVTSVCDECGCPLVHAGFLHPTPLSCQCSLGWVKAVFEIICGAAVQAKLNQAIGRGDPVCEFTVYLPSSVL
jgi:hypothetical protein